MIIETRMGLSNAMPVRRCRSFAPRKAMNVMDIRKILLSRKLMMRRKSAPHNLVNPSCDSYYYECTDCCGADNWQPLFLNQAETPHDTHAGGHEKEAEVLYEEVGNLVDPECAYNPEFQGGGKKYHSDNARWNRDSCEGYDEFSRSQEGKQHCTL